ncbi:tetratricopeptide repeat protein [Oharaeibacter diazotrophicus]|uniref:Ancillary SecYEG translocon subunit/Cell division coordinator CpoB TPR domain-containing protein n=1 Tax=Oharaeibacter diazotrophicus TaxID=1920512 RepID=A0A4R6RLZ5_9HYPH|nr:tetratricopeptide repeat protein [Oharaeibacter diazotrophicus]TDP86776.1 hypothetical protein EDD54_0659 [Oharaeibacter diazotrophicus]BBE71281.1 hypothetical protein OHA_1_00852 [Pleomorphomonas sp. SM30]GLS78036.1 hypothetical protein GCM10007904_33730 [Oharaeibacter diazotrophicus]
MTDIFDEVGEDLRRDRLTKLWKSYSGVVIGVAVLIVAGTAAWRGWEYYTERQAAAAGDAFRAALASAKDEDHGAVAEALTAFASDAPKDYRALALMRAAAERLAAGETDNALAAFETISKDAAVPQEIRDVAALRAAMVAVDRDDLAAIKARVAPYDNDVSPWRFSARELVALAAVKAEAWDEARAALAKIDNDPQTPQDVSSRAGILSGIVRAAAGEPAKPATPAGS